MSVIPKHDPKKNKTAKNTKTQPAAVLPATTLEVDMSGVEVAIADIAHSVKSYVVNAVDGDNSLNLFTGTHSYPVRLVLEGDAVDSIADSLKRIAEAMAAK